MTLLLELDSIVEGYLFIEENTITSPKISPVTKVVIVTVFPEENNFCISMLPSNIIPIVEQASPSIAITSSFL